VKNYFSIFIPVFSISEKDESNTSGEKQSGKTLAIPKNHA